MGRVSKTMPDSRLHSRNTNLIRILSAIFVAVGLIFVLYSDRLIFSSFRDADTSSSSQIQIKSAIIKQSLHLRSVQNDEEDRKTTINNPFVPPLNATEGERIAWLQRKLPKLDIFKSDRVTRQFHSRVLQFFDPGCDIRVFMTWISPAMSFGSREFLAVESLFKAHPNGCLMILSRTLDSVRGYRILKPLIDRRFKVQAVTPDLPFLFNDTPAETWLNDIKRGNKDPGEIPLAQNLSNLMRLAVLYKYGGVYLDTDFIVLKPLTRLRNSIGAQSVDVASKNWTRLNNAVLIFDMKHPLLWSFLEEFASTFDGNRWGHNGPYLVSRVVRRVETTPGLNFIVLPPMAFYPVDWTKIGGLFERPKSEAQSRWVKAKLLQLSGDTYGVHLWNKQSSSLLIEEGSIMGKLISDHCIICKDVYSPQKKIF
ncbi:Alpha 1,4-glycosyltransferase domain containing protein [Parasponia andersonii]|uniref:Alpha 1,4-glycosyltransferase domain containing protein n=1 Tax=Parasponia andersonii TaxID=3476 RepID=A0A2P5B455_PARAD|nr:Alpha 1,4-glycosyltransferase domain containing protein [Parasponia andersonii]